MGGWEASNKQKFVNICGVPPGKALRWLTWTMLPSSITYVLLLIKVFASARGSEEKEHGGPATGGSPVVYEACPHPARGWELLLTLRAQRSDRYVYISQIATWAQQTTPLLFGNTCVVSASLSRQGPATGGTPSLFFWKRSSHTPSLSICF